MVVEEVHTPLSSAAFDLVVFVFLASFAGLSWLPQMI